MEMYGRVSWEWDATECRAGGPFPVSWLFSDCSPAFPCLTVSFFLSFFFFFDIERFQFPFLVSLLFLFFDIFLICARARAFLFCSGWLLDFPAPFSLSPNHMSSPQKNTQAWRVLTAGWFLRHMYSLTKWKCDSDAVMSEYKRPTVASLLSRWLRCWSGQQANNSSIPRRWRTRSWTPRSRMKTTKSSATSLPIWKVTSS